MSLSCECGEWDGDGEYWMGANDYTTLQTKRRQRCQSCKSLIEIGAICIKFDRFRSPVTDVEERIWGDEVQLANKYHCEICADIFFSLEELGYCVGWHQDMRELAKEYAELKEEEKYFKQHGEWPVHPLKDDARHEEAS